MDAAVEYFMYDEFKSKSLKRRKLMLWTIVVILLVLWLVGYFGPNVFTSIPRSGNAVHTLLVIVVILVVLSLLGII